MRNGNLYNGEKYRISQYIRCFSLVFYFHADISFQYFQDAIGNDVSQQTISKRENDTFEKEIFKRFSVCYDFQLE